MSVVSKLADLLEHPERVSELPVEAVPALRGKLFELDTLLLSLIARPAAPAPVQHHCDRLLDANEAAKRLGVSKVFVYKNAGKYPFVVREGRRLLFSEKGLESYLRGKRAI